MTYFSTLLLSMFITLGLVPILTRLAMHFQLVDVPDARKVHTFPVPRVGGLAIACGAVAPLLFRGQLDQFAMALLLAIVVIVMFGIADDLVGLGYRAKFSGQILAALIVIVFGKVGVTNLGGCLPQGSTLPVLISVPLTLLIVVAVTNAINLADGLDGLAGGIMVQVFICLGLLAYRCDSIFIALLCTSVTGAVFGFLRFNTYPASVFMGDTGSQLIGFLSITLALSVTQANNAVSPFIPIVLLGFPVMDTAVVMYERIRQGNSPFKADRNHFHHKLLHMNMYHREAVFVIYLVQAIFVGAAYIFRFYSDWIQVLTYLVLVSFLLFPVYWVHNRGVQLQRTGIVDTFFKQILRTGIKENRVYLRAAQKTIEIGVPAIFLFAVLLPADIPKSLTIISASIFVAIGLAFWFQSSLIGPLVRGIAYLLLPFLLFQCFVQTAPWVTVGIFRFFIFSNAAVAFFAILLLKYTRRRKGFEPTPTDFLIVLLAVVLPNLPDFTVSGTQLGFWGTCLIIFFFSLEVLLGELRKEDNVLGISTLPALGALVLRGFT